MSDMLKQAIIDANALKEAAIKNAETLVIEKYSSEIKETIQKLLSEEEAAAPMATATVEPTTTTVVNDLPSTVTNDDREMVRIDLKKKKKKLMQTILNQRVLKCVIEMISQMILQQTPKMTWA